MADGGDVELVEVIGNTAYVNMTGACNGCQMAAMTIAGIQQRPDGSDGRIYQGRSRIANA